MEENNTDFSSLCFCVVTISLALENVFMIYRSLVRVSMEASGRFEREANACFSLLPELAHNTTDSRKLTLLIFTCEYKFS